MPPFNFVLSSITRAQNKGQDQWRALLRSAWYPNRHMELWFDDEAQARQIPLGTVSIPTIFGLYFSGQQSIKCMHIIKTPTIYKKNLWTDRTETENAWSVGFKTPSQTGGLQEMNLQYPSRTEAMVWSPSRSYNLPAIIGTLAPAQTTALFVCQITLANNSPLPFAAANVTSVVTQAIFGAATVQVPQLSFNGNTLTIEGTLLLSNVFAGQGLADASTEASGNTVTLLNAQGLNQNLWTIERLWNPAAMMGLLQPQIASYPAAAYLLQNEPVGFFDTFGYHPPATYQAGNYTGGFVWINGQFLTGAAALAAAGPAATFVLGDDAILQSVSSAGVNSIIVNGNLNGQIVPGYNAGQIQFQAF